MMQSTLLLIWTWVVHKINAVPAWNSSYLYDFNAKAPYFFQFGIIYLGSIVHTECKCILQTPPPLTIIFCDRLAYRERVSAFDFSNPFRRFCNMSVLRLIHPRLSSSIEVRPRPRISRPLGVRPWTIPRWRVLRSRFLLTAVIASSLTWQCSRLNLISPRHAPTNSLMDSAEMEELDRSRYWSLGSNIGSAIDERRFRLRSMGPPLWELQQNFVHSWKKWGIAGFIKV